jgi:hypothetical protein
MFYISVIRTIISTSLQEPGRHIVFMSSMSPRMSSQGRWRKQRASCIGLPSPIWHPTTGAARRARGWSCSTGCSLVINDYGKLMSSCSEA